MSAILNRAIIRPESGSSATPFDTISVSPLYLGKESTFVIETRSAALQVKFYITNSLYTDKEIASKVIMSKGTHIVKYNNDSTVSSGNQLHIAYKVMKGFILSPKINMNVATDTNRHLVDNQSFNSNSYVYVLDYSTLTWSSHKVNYGFSNFDGLYIPDYYHKIKLDDFAVSVTSGDTKLFKCNPSLYIKNVNGVFNDVSTADMVEFKLKTVDTLIGFTFELQDILYVNKETLILSKTAKEGYVATKHIYLPRNDMQNQDKYKSIFAIYDFGIDRDLLRHDFELRALKNIIGDCQNSEYCIQRL